MDYKMGCSSSVYSNEGRINDHKQNQHDKYDSTEGLPNIGNTCFLNSALQVLYSATPFRNYILQIQNPQNLFANYLQQIFRSIKSQAERPQKAFLMEKFVHLLRNHHQQYYSFSQQDSYDFLNLIIHKIGEEWPQCIDMFTIQFTILCGCKRQNNLLYVQTLIPIDPQICSQCNQLQQYQVFKYPLSLICVGNKKSPGRKFFQLKDHFQKTTTSYELCSKIIYFGSGRCGHYIAYRKNKNGQFCYFDDSQVVKQSKSNRDGPVTVFLYQKIPSKSSYNDEIYRKDKSYDTKNFNQPQKDKANFQLRPPSHEKFKHSQTKNLTNQKEVNNYHHNDSKNQKQQKKSDFRYSNGSMQASTPQIKSEQCKMGLNVDLKLNKIDEIDPKSGQKYKKNQNQSLKAKQIQNKVQLDTNYRYTMILRRNKANQPRQIYFKIIQQRKKDDSFIVEILNRYHFNFLSKNTLKIWIDKPNFTLLDLAQRLQNTINQKMKGKQDEIKSQQGRQKFYRTDFMDAKIDFKLLENYTTINK